jgi:hypothetical protein
MSIRIENSPLQLSTTQSSQASRVLIDDEALRPPLPEPESSMSEAELTRELAALAQRFASATPYGAQSPELLMMAIANMMQNTTEASNRAQFQGISAEREVHIRAQLDAAMRAEGAEQTGTIWSTIAKIAGYVGTAVGAVALVAGAIATGGALAIAAGVVGATAAATTLTARSLTDLGALDARGSKVMSLVAAVMGIVSAALSLGAGAGSLLGAVSGGVSVAGQAGNAACDVVELAGIEVPTAVRLVMVGTSAAGAAGSLASGLGRAAGHTARITDAATRMVSSVARVGTGISRGVEGICAGVSAGYSHAAVAERASSKNEATQIERLSTDRADVIEQLRAAYALTERMNTRSSEILEERTATRHVLSRNMLRG